MNGITPIGNFLTIPSERSLEDLNMDILLEIFQYCHPVDLALKSLISRKFKIIIADEHNEKKLYIPWVKLLVSHLLPNRLIARDEEREFCSIIFDNSIQKMRELNVKGKDFFIRIFKFINKVEAPYFLCKKNTDYENALDIKFALSFLGIGTYEKFLTSCLNYVNKIQVQCRTDFLIDRINSYVSAPDESGTFITNVLNIDHAAFFNIDTSICSFTPTSEQDLSEILKWSEHRNFRALYNFPFIRARVVEYCIKKRDKESLWKLAERCSATDDYLDSTKGSDSPNDPQKIYSLKAKPHQYPSPVKLCFDLYKLFKDDPEIIKFSQNNCNSLFPFTSKDNYKSLIICLIHEGYDDDAIELYGLSPLNPKEKEECSLKMNALFKAKGIYPRTF